MQYRSLTDRPVEVRSEGDRHIITGYAAVYDSLSHDLGGFRERIKRGAFDRSLKEIANGSRDVSARIQHEGGLSTVGTTRNASLRLWSDSVGLGYEMSGIPNTSAGRDLVELVSGGYISKSSFAFTVPANGRKIDYNTSPPTVELLDVDLIDVAPVDGPAYEATSVQMRNLIMQELRPPIERRSRVEVRALDSGQKRVEIHILDQIVPSYIASYFEDGLFIGSKQVMDQLAAVPDADGIDVYINSPGGDVFEGHAIYNTLKDHPAPVNVFVRGLAASAAGVVAMAGDHIQMGEGSFLMVHNAWTVAQGNASEMRKAANLLDSIDGSIGGILARRSGNDVKEVAKWMNEETWFNAESAVEHGFADRVGGAPAAIDEGDGERCRKLGYRNIPSEIGGAGPAPEQRQMSNAELMELQKRSLKKTA